LNSYIINLGKGFSQGLIASKGYQQIINSVIQGIESYLEILLNLEFVRRQLQKSLKQQENQNER
jgi:hypothetical protein